MHESGETGKTGETGFYPVFAIPANSETTSMETAWFSVVFSKNHWKSLEWPSRTLIIDQKGPKGPKGRTGEDV